MKKTLFKKFQKSKFSKISKFSKKFFKKNFQEIKFFQNPGHEY